MFLSELTWWQGSTSGRIYSTRRWRTSTPWQLLPIVCVVVTHHSHLPRSSWVLDSSDGICTTFIALFSISNGRLALPFYFMGSLLHGLYHQYKVVLGSSDLHKCFLSLALTLTGSKQSNTIKLREASDFPMKKLSRYSVRSVFGRIWSYATSVGGCKRVRAVPYEGR